MLRIRSLSWILAGSLILSGCGGSESSPSPGTSGKKGSAKVSSDQDGGTKDKATQGATGAAKDSASWGTLRGRFVYDGEVPEQTFLATSGKDAEVCGKEPIPDESLVVDESTRGIKNVVVYARKTSRVHPSFDEGGMEPVVFDQKNCIFLSHVVALRVDQTLSIKNSDPIGHNTNISPLGDQRINPLLPEGSTHDYAFTRQQSVPVEISCNVHPWMKAYALPRKDPYFAVSAPDGSFEISLLPAAEEIEFQVWHERSSAEQGSLAAQSDWKQGRFKASIEPDGTTDLGDIGVNAAAFR